MRVEFVRSGERRYGVVVTLPDGTRRSKDPAPGYDPAIPHDLVHYVLEAELGLEGGLYGRMARGGGHFVDVEPAGSPRERARARRRQLRRERTLREADHAGAADMERSERLVAVVDVRWRRRHGQQPGVGHQAPAPVGREDDAAVEQVVDRLDELAPAWAAVRVGGSLAFVWPGTTPA